MRSAGRALAGCAAVSLVAWAAMSATRPERPFEASRAGAVELRESAPPSKSRPSTTAVILDSPGPAHEGGINRAAREDADDSSREAMLLARLVGSRADDERFAAARLLARSGTRAAVVGVLRALLDARARGEAIFADQLLQALSEAGTGQGADVLVDILGEDARVELGDFDALPADVQEAVLKGIRTSPVKADVDGRLGFLFENDRRPKVRERVLDVGRPGSSVAIAVTARSRGDAAAATDVLARLASADPHEVIESFLAQMQADPSASRFVPSLLSQWAGASTSPTSGDALIAVATDYQRTPVERAAAAQALAASPAGGEARQAVEKLLAREVDPEIRAVILQSMN